jgi:hypothetical protein
LRKHFPVGRGCAGWLILAKKRGKQGRNEDLADPEKNFWKNRKKFKKTLAKANNGRIIASEL